jgi:hypothetical protein
MTYAHIRRTAHGLGARDRRLLGNGLRLYSVWEHRRMSEASATPSAPESPVALIVTGLLVSGVLGGLLLFAGAAGGAGAVVLLGYLVVVVGTVLTSVGTIAAGVRLGMRWARFDQSV